MTSEQNIESVVESALQSLGVEYERFEIDSDFADTAIANVTAALKAKGMWKDTLVVFSSDK